MTDKKISRINFLAKKSKTEGLNEAERLEQTALRNEYRLEFRKSLALELERIEFIKESAGEEIK